jgi:cellulose synthase/poly-beta-1,6-N-acetylglucosamine synthase-like glycosyltransferase
VTATRTLVTFLFFGGTAVLLTAYLVPLYAFLTLVTVAALVARLRGRRGPATGSPGRSPRFLIVIPAHDEEPNIGATVASCRALAYDPAAFDLWVIADNCTDGTARAAREAGAEVFERSDDQRRSKGYALEDFFRDATETGRFARYDAAVVIDADTVVDPELLARFAEALDGGTDWAQGYYTVRNPDASWRTRLLTYAFSLFNGVWLLGQDRLGLGVGFRGNGMYFSRRGLQRVPWKAYGLVEDQEFSWILRVAGERVRFLPEARVYGEMVSRGRSAVSQRRRWEEGRRSLRGRFLRPLLTSAALSPYHKVLLLLDLVFPPMMPLLTTLLLAVAVHPAALAVPALAPVSRALLPFHAWMVLATAAYAASPFLTLGLPLRYAANLAVVPYFAVWKFLATFNARTSGWVRTQRESAAGRGPV